MTRSDLTRKPSKSSARVYDAIVRIKEPGPLPMRDHQPTEKYLNGVDRFRKQHQDDYASCDSREDPTGYVNRHNAANPKMYDELERRRCDARVGTYPSCTRDFGCGSSIPHNAACLKMFDALERKRSRARPKMSTTLKARQNSANLKFLDPKCKHCRKIITQMKKKATNATGRNRRVEKNTRKRNHKKSFVVNKKYTRDGEQLDFVSEDSKAIPRGMGAEIECTNEKESNTSTRDKHDVSQCSSSTRGSMRSSYHSMSLDQEPMVTQ